MKLLYKDYEYPSLFLDSNGYIMEVNNNVQENYWGNISHYDGIKYIKSEDNICYFEEADIVSQINDNENNYFDFSKSIIDIGAQWGCYSFRTFFNYSYTFEPNEYAYHILCVNLMLHDRYDISKVYNVCLSDKEEELLYDGFNTDINRISKDASYKILTHTLDEYHCENVGLIKVDVEGMEEKVLRGGINTIKNNNYPPILFELWDIEYCGMTQEKHDSLVNFLTELGYKILWKWGNFQTHLAIHN